MSKYAEINRIINIGRQDIGFPIEFLDDLTEIERKDIEKKITDNCLDGITAYYKYIKYLKYYNLHDVFTIENISKIREDEQLMLLNELYYITNDLKYLERILEMSEKSLQAFSYLTIIYLNRKLPHEFLSKMQEICEKAVENKDAYISLYHRIDKSYNPKTNGFVWKNNIIDDGRISIKKIEDALIGFAIGDAMGVPIEFKSRYICNKNPLTEMVGYGSHDVPEGTWSDDTSMTIATMDSVIQTGRIDYNDIIKKYCEWEKYAKYTATDKLFDIGIGTRKALNIYESMKINPTKCGSTDIMNNGNGSLMRMLPIVLYLYKIRPNEIYEMDIINNYSSLTHGHEISRLGCKIYYDFISGLLSGMNKEDALLNLQKINYSQYYSRETIDLYSRILNGSISNDDISTIRSSGYIVDTLEAVIWTIMNTDSYENAIIKAINLGEDTDTIGAITGSIAGIIYGKENIPERWLNKLKKKDYLESIAKDFYDTIIKMKNNRFTDTSVFGSYNDDSNKSKKI